MKEKPESGENANKSRFENGVFYICGTAFHMAWIFTSMYSVMQIYGNTSNFSSILGIEGDGYSLLYLVSAVAFLATSFFAAAKDQKLLALTRLRKFLIASAIIGAIATLIPLLSLDNVTASMALECISGLGTGVCSAILLLCWSVRYASRRSSFILTCSSAGITGGFFISVAIIRALPVPLGGIADALMPLLECVFLVAATPAHFSPECATETFLPMPINKGKAFRVLLPSLLLLGISLGMLKYTAAQDALDTMSGRDLPIMVIMIAFGIIALFSYYGTLSKKSQWDPFLRIYAPVLTCICLVVSFFMEEGSVFKDFFFLFSYLETETLLWIYFPHISHRLSISPLYITGAARSITSLGVLAGTLLATTASLFAFQPIASKDAICAIACVFLALSFALMPRETRFMGILIDCPVVHLAAIQESGKVDVLNMLAIPKATKDDDQQESPEKTNKKPEIQEKQVAATQPLQKDEGSLGASQTKVPSDYPNDAFSEDHNEKHPAGKFTQRVLKVSKTFLLTERETDVLFELAKGNSPEYIQEKFVLSSATVKTHIRNIYRKLDVHKRNDLMRLIENIDNYD